MSGATAALVLPSIARAGALNIPDAAFDYLRDYGDVSSATAPGVVNYNLDIERGWQRRRTKAHGLSREAYFSWETGSDEAGDGSKQRPFKTCAKAAGAASETVWALPQTSYEILDLTGHSVAVRAAKPGTVTFGGRAEVAQAIRWEDFEGRLGGIPKIHRARVYSMSLRRGGQIVPVPFSIYGDFGWFQDWETERVFLGRSIMRKDLPNLVIGYQTVHYHKIAADIFFKGIDFLGSHPISVTGAIHAKGCMFIQSYENAIRTHGAHCALQDCFAWGTGDDCLNYNDAGGRRGTVLEVNVRAAMAGWMLSPYGVSPSEPRNHQASTTHDTVTAIRIGGRYGHGCYGQSIADTGSSGRRWMVGTVIDAPAPNFPRRRYQQSAGYYVQGDVWLDNVRASGSADSYGLVMVNGRIRQFNCEWNGGLGPVFESQSSTESYDPTTV